MIQVQKTDSSYDIYLRFMGIKKKDSFLFTLDIKIGYSDTRSYMVIGTMQGYNA